MKKVGVVLMMSIFLFSGCAKQGRTNDPETSSIAVPGESQISIFYGVSSYAMFDAEEAVIGDLYDRFSPLEFEKTAEKIDMMSMLSVNLQAKGKGSLKFSVDKNGVFWINGDAQGFRIKSGTFDYAYLKKLYDDSRTK